MEKGSVNCFVLRGSFFVTKLKGSLLEEWILFWVGIMECKLHGVDTF